MTFISLEDALKTSQTLFYVVASFVTILTYRSAKKGLLNSVNTEYQKRVMDRLKELSDELFSEFDEDSPRYWGNTMVKEDHFGKVVDSINKMFKTNQETILKEKRFDGGYPGPIGFERMESLLNRVKTDPFIPKQVRDEVIDLLEARVKTMEEVCFSKLDQYKRELANGKHIKNLSQNRHWLHNKVNDELYKRGCGISQIEEGVHSIRLFIQAYMESFNPHRNRKVKKPLLLSSRTQQA